MGQRAITQVMLDTVSKYGISMGDKRILDRKNIDGVLRELDRERQKLLKLRDKGGLVVIETNDVLITAYRLGSFDRRRKG